MKKENIHLVYTQPDYYKNFHCVGSACRNNCCNQLWTITVDKNTYKMYRNAKASYELMHQLSKYVKKNPKSKKNSDYALLTQLTNPTRCALQTEEGLCAIHRELGEEYLCMTCKIYPRNVRKIQFQDMTDNRNYFNRACCVSCEAVADIFIRHSEPLQMEIVEEEFPRNVAISSITSCTVLVTFEIATFLGNSSSTISI